MTIDAAIFSLRFGSNSDIYPTHDDLQAFLRSPKEEGGRDLHQDDLAAYEGYLRRFQSLGQHPWQDANGDVRVKMFQGVLGHTQFFNPALKLAVEHFKYHLHAFKSLDFRKPSAFIKSAEEEIARLNPKKKEEAARLARLVAMVDERKKALESMNQLRSVLAPELTHIARYVKDNLMRIERLCSACITLVEDPQTARDEESRAMEDIKAQMKEQLRDALHHGAVTKEDLEKAKEDVAVLSGEITFLLGQDLSSVTALYAAVQAHAKKFDDELGALLTGMGTKKAPRYEDERDLFQQVEHALVRLVSDCGFEPSAAGLPAGTKHESTLREKRREMLDHVFELLQKERRSWHERRSGEDRRTFKDPNFEGPERRSSEERRAKHDRR